MPVTSKSFSIEANGNQGSDSPCETTAQVKLFKNVAESINIKAFGDSKEMLTQTFKNLISLIFKPFSDLIEMATLT